MLRFTLIIACWFDKLVCWFVGDDPCEIISNNRENVCNHLLKKELKVDATTQSQFIKPDSLYKKYRRDNKRKRRR